VEALGFVSGGAADGNRRGNGSAARPAGHEAARAANPTRYPMKEVCPVERREEVNREPKPAEAPKAEPKLKRFRLVKLEERIAPLASGGGSGGYSDCYSIPTLFTCSR
jgi:hypothetical protein